MTNIWFDHLNQGTCFGVYNSFSDVNTSLVDYYASSKHVSVYKIDVTDLEKAAENSIQLRNNLDIVKLRIKNNHVGDIDYFKYPKRFLEKSIAKSGVNDY